MINKSNKKSTSSNKAVKESVESGAYIKTIMDSLEDELMVIGKDYKILDVNKAALLRHNKSKQEIIGKNCYEISHGLSEICHPPYHECPIKVTWETGKAHRTTHVHVYDIAKSNFKNNRYLDIIASPILDSKGNVSAVVELMRDVTAAKEMENQLVESHNNLLVLNTIATAVSQSLDLDIVLSTALDKTLEVLKFNTGCILLWDEAKQALCYKVYQGLSENYVEKQFCSLGEGVAGRVAKTGKTILIEDTSSNTDDPDYQLAFAEGLRAFASVPLVAKSKILGVLSVASRESRKFSAQDIQLLDSIAAQIAVAVENAKLHKDAKRKDEIRGELLREIFSIQEEERIRIARELHDETSQVLASLVANLEAASGMLGKDTDTVYGRLKEAQAISVTLLDEVHNIIYELRPTLLDDLGLVSAVRWLIDKNLRDLGIAVHFRTSGQEKRLPSNIETTIYRVIQEAVSNIARHANADNVSVNLQFQVKRIKFTIKDDGKGFDLEEAINTRERPRGLGLLGMMERIQLINGSIKINSSKKSGTEVIVMIPVSYEDANG
ncbi:GAF domain-containing protein [Chloroflexota bacterium]